MNMLFSSLKALLFSSASPAMVARPGAGEGTADFAAMLNGSMAEALPAEAAATPPLAQAEGVTPELAVDVDQAAQQAVQDHVPPGLAVAVAAGKGVPGALPPGLALGLVNHAAELQPVPPIEGPAETEVAQIELDSEAVQPRPEIAQAPVEIKAPAKPHRVGQKEVARQPPAVITEGGAKPVEAGAEGEMGADQQEKIAVPNGPDALPVILPAMAIAAVPAPVASEAPAAEGAEPPVAAPAALPVASPVVSQGVASALAPAPLPVAQAEPASAPLPRRAPLAVENKSAEAREPSKSAERVAPALPEFATKQDRPVEERPAIATESQPVSAPILNSKPVKAEALALLQMVRDRVASRQPGGAVRASEQVSAVAVPKGKSAAPQAEVATDQPASVQAPEILPSIPSAASQPVAPSAAPSVPVVDLSASLGAQVVDMGVSGQWIDGLARDIAGLSANGAQGRFQIRADQLGAVQVDIRQGSDGAAVSLTVANEAAELALRQDSDRLKLDAGLAAVRISEVRVERAAPVAEAHRPDMGGQSSSQQQQPQQQGSQTASAWQNGNQNMGQSQGQHGRWQARENNGFGPKSSGDPAVLNHADAQPAASSTVRARYA